MSEMLDFDSANYAPDEAFALYRELYAVGSDVRRTPDPFFAHVRGWRLERTLLFLREYGGVRHRRSERAGTDGFDHLVLHHVLDGELTGGRIDAPERVGPGETLLLDTRCAMDNGARAVRLITVSLARSAAQAAAGGLEGLHGRRIGAGEGALLSAYLRALVAQAPELPPGARPTATRVLVDLLSIALDPAGTGARSDFYRLEYVRREAAQRLIDARLTDNDFTVQDIVRDTGISRSSLYRLFEAYGGVQRFIQLRRLQHLRGRLDDRDFDDRSLAELAPLSGFSSDAHAGRVFKQAFGISPGAYRAASRHQASPRTVDAMSRRWVSGLSELS